MEDRPRSWWKKISKPLDTVIISFIVALIAVIIVSILGYLFRWEWTGLTPSLSPLHPINSDFLPGKTLWDWLQLLIVPAVLAIGGYLFNYSTSRNEQKATQQRDQTERDIASDNQREAALQSYIDKISELLLDKHLRESQPQDEVRTVARVRTLTTLPRLDAARKGSVIQYLQESQLIGKDKNIINLEGANLSGANLVVANLSGANLVVANLSGANLSVANLVLANLVGANLSEAILFGANLVLANLVGADLSGADLSEADLGEAILFGANLSGANLSGANLSGADLNGAKISTQQLDQIRSLINATMPDGSKHP